MALLLSGTQHTAKILLQQTASCRLFSTSPAAKVRRAVVYSNNGDPAENLKVVSVPSTLGPPPPSTINIRFLLSPVNPSDVNVIEGVYPAKAAPRNLLDLLPTTLDDADRVFVGGNEGLAKVTDVGDDVKGLKRGDWVVMVKQQAGTWCSDTNVLEGDVVRIPKIHGQLPSEVNAAMMTVNPPTAFNMLRDFVDLKPGDWVLQNGANSAVGQAVIQIAAHRGLKTLNLVRDRDDFAALEARLISLGANRVLPYSALDPTVDKTRAKATRSSLQDMFSGLPPRLALNCVSGPPTTHMSSLLGVNATLVSYGAMSKQPLALPTSLFIFKGLTCKGFWQSQWYKTHSEAERVSLMRDLVGLVVDGKLKEPENDILTIHASEDDDSATHALRHAIQKIQRGKYGKKMLIRFSSG